jgi:hypothetical protein
MFYLVNGISTDISLIKCNKIDGKAISVTSIGGSGEITYISKCHNENEHD